MASDYFYTQNAVARLCDQQYLFTLQPRNLQHFGIVLRYVETVFYCTILILLLFCLYTSRFFWNKSF